MLVPSKDHGSDIVLTGRFPSQLASLAPADADGVCYPRSWSFGLLGFLVWTVENYRFLRNLDCRSLP